MYFLMFCFFDVSQRVQPVIVLQTFFLCCCAAHFPVERQLWLANSYNFAVFLKFFLDWNHALINTL